MSSSEEEGALSGPEELSNTEETVTEKSPTKEKSIFSDGIPTTKYGDLIEKQRSKKRAREARDDELPTPKRSKKRKKDEAPELIEESDEELEEFIQKKEEVDHSMKTKLWYGYIRLCEAFDHTVGEPTGFASIIENSVDVKESFNMCIDSGSFGEYIKDVDPLYLLLFSTGMIALSCKGTGWLGGTSQRKTVRAAPEPLDTPTPGNRVEEILRNQGNAVPPPVSQRKDTQTQQRESHAGFDILF